MTDYVDALIDAFPETAGWSVTSQVGYDGQVVIVVEHDGTDQTFALSGSADCIRVIHLLGDKLTREETFPDIKTALDTMRHVGVK